MEQNLDVHLKNKVISTGKLTLAYGKASIPDKISTELAEFVGIMLGDGNISKEMSQVTISCRAIDGSYLLKYIPYLIKHLFSKDVYFKKHLKTA